LSGFYTFIVLLGTYAEFVLPALIVFGLFTRFAALGMIGFVFIQTLTDIYGHGVDEATIGAWFDRASDALILDQRLLWVTILMVIFARGPGTLSLDKLFGAEMHTHEI
jgi:putative oxidoreductase